MRIPNLFRKKPDPLTPTQIRDLENRASNYLTALANLEHGQIYALVDEDAPQPVPEDMLVDALERTTAPIGPDICRGLVDSSVEAFMIACERADIDTIPEDRRMSQVITASMIVTVMRPWLDHELYTRVMEPLTRVGVHLDNH